MNVAIQSSMTVQIMPNVLIYMERIHVVAKMDFLTYHITPNFQAEFVLVSYFFILLLIKSLSVNYFIIYLLAELIGCDLCNYHGTCYLSNQDETICECFQWYAGKHCQFNLKGK